MLFSKKWLLPVLWLAVISSGYALEKSKVPYFAKWPVAQSTIAKAPRIENKIIAILSLMTLQEKVGQMIQPDLREVTPQEAKEYKLGSLLNGGGGWQKVINMPVSKIGH